MEYGSRPEELRCAIGPSICQDCYEVSGDVIEEFRAAFPETLHEKLFYGKPDGKISTRKKGWKQSVRNCRDSSMNGSGPPTVNWKKSVITADKRFVIRNR